MLSYFVMIFLICYKISYTIMIVLLLFFDYFDTFIFYFYRIDIIFCCNHYSISFFYFNRYIWVPCDNDKVCVTLTSPNLSFWMLFSITVLTLIQYQYHSSIFLTKYLFILYRWKIITPKFSVNPSCPTHQKSPQCNSPVNFLVSRFLSKFSLRFSFQF